MRTFKLLPKINRIWTLNIRLQFHWLKSLAKIYSDHILGHNSFASEPKAEHPTYVRPPGSSFNNDYHHQSVSQYSKPLSVYQNLPYETHPHHSSTTNPSSNYHHQTIYHPQTPTHYAQYNRNTEEYVSPVVHSLPRNPPQSPNHQTPRPRQRDPYTTVHKEKGRSKYSSYNPTPRPTHHVTNPPQSPNHQTPKPRQRDPYTTAYKENVRSKYSSYNPTPRPKQHVTNPHSSYTPKPKPSSTKHVTRQQFKQLTRQQSLKQRLNEVIFYFPVPLKQLNARGRLINLIW